MAPFWITFAIAFAILLVLGLVAMAQTFGGAFTGRGPRGPLGFVAWLAMHPFRVTDQSEVVEGLAGLIFLIILNLLIWSLLIASAVYMVLRMG